MAFLVHAKAERQESFAIQFTENAAAPKACHHALIHREVTSVMQSLPYVDVRQPLQLATETITALWDLALVIFLKHDRNILSTHLKYYTKSKLWMKLYIITHLNPSTAIIHVFLAERIRIESTGKNFINIYHRNMVKYTLLCINFQIGFLYSILVDTI